MPALYSTVLASEPDYGDRVVMVHAGCHHAGISQTEGVDLLTGERVLLPISTSWDSKTDRNIRVSAEGWSWQPIHLREAEKRVGLPPGALPAYSDNGRTDLWADQRMRSAAFIALLSILTDHPEVVFYEVDWRAWVHCERPPEYPHREGSALLERPKQSGVMGEGRHVPYPLGGSGDMERYASYLGRLLGPPSSPVVLQADQVYDTLSDAVLADLRHHYDSNVEWQQREHARSRLHNAPADMPIVRSLDDIQALVGWTPEVLAELDALHAETKARLDEETAAYRPQSVALCLF